MNIRPFPKVWSRCAIVRLHEFIETVKGKKQQWASGAIVTREARVR